MAFEKPTLETVKLAIKTALSEDPNSDRQSSTEWLENLKKSVYAWEICDQLLSANEGIDVSYLAANMLKHKISKNFHELPSECYPSLKNSIFNHLQRSDDYAVQGQLTIAIADLTLLLNDWQNPIEDLAKDLGLEVSLNNLHETDYVAIMKALHSRLIFAYILHQMCDLNHQDTERPARIGAKRREEYEDYLISKCSQIISWWLSTINEIILMRQRFSNGLTKDDAELTSKAKCLEKMDKLVGQIYLCYSAWLRIFDEQNVNDSLQIIDAAFKHLNDQECSDHIHKYAVEVIVSTAIFCDDNKSVDYLIDHLVTQVYQLEQAFKQSINSEDVEKSTNLAKAFTIVAEIACYRHIMEKKDSRLLELMMNCLVHYDFEVVEETYSFWWLLIGQLQEKSNTIDRQPFISYINRFIIAIVKLCQFDPDEDSVVDLDQDIHAFRQTSSELIVGSIFISEVKNFIQDNKILENLLCENSWEKTEAILFLLNNLTKLLTRDENKLRDQIFQCILRQQTKIQDLQTLLTCDQLPIRIGTNPTEVHPQVVATTLNIISSLENFLADYPDYLVLAIKYILNSLSDAKYRAKLMPSAADALSTIVQLNATRHLQGLPQLIAFVKDLCRNLDSFDDESACELLRCSSYLIDALDGANAKDQFLCEVTLPTLNSLKNVLQPNSSGGRSHTEYMDRLSALFKNAKVAPDVLHEMRLFISLVETELWPIIVEVLSKGPSLGSNTIERTCRVIRYLIRFLKPDWMIERIAETMINLYKTYPQYSSPLYICSVLVDEFANRSPEINAGLFAMLEIFCTLTFTLLDMNASQSKSLLTMKSYPETIDDMMRLFTRFMKRCPVEFVNCKALESIIELSISSLRIDHQEANATVCSFVSSFISLGSKPEHRYIGDAIRNVLGARFVDASLRAMLFDIPASLIASEAQILFALRNFDGDLLVKWIEASVSSLPNTNIQGVQSVLPDQIEDFKKTITTADTVKKMVNCIRAFARLYS